MPLVHSGRSDALEIAICPWRWLLAIGRGLLSGSHTMKTVSPAVIPIITIDRTAVRPLHQQVYDAYRAAIAEGTLRAAQRVPSTRVLAAELGVSRIPVLHAYAQLLAEGYFHS